MVLKPPRVHGDPPTGADRFESPEELETAIAELLALAGDLDASAVTVTASGRVITLSGRVNSTEEAQRVVDLVLDAPGVTYVANGLVIGDDAKARK